MFKVKGNITFKTDNQAKYFKYLESCNDLRCSNNELTNLNLENLKYCDNLYCYENKLNHLNLENLKYCDNLYCYNNELTNLNCKGLKKIRFLSCNNNPEPINSLTVETIKGFNNFN